MRARTQRIPFPPHRRTGAPNAGESTSARPMGSARRGAWLALASTRVSSTAGARGRMRFILANDGR